MLIDEKNESLNGKENSNETGNGETHKAGSPSSVTTKPLLSGVVSRTNVERLGTTDMYRKYVSTVSSTMKMKGNLDSTTKTILYEIGVRTFDPGALAPIEAGHGVSQIIRTSKIVSAELVGLHKKFPAFSGVFEVCDLAAIGNQLGKALGLYAATGVLTCNAIRGGEAPNVQHLGYSNDPVSASRSSVFIPRNAGLDLTPGVFYVIAAAANAYGSVVYTDYVTVDGNGAVILDEPVGTDCAVACLGAMRILMKLYHDCSQGSVMSLAFVRGLHSTATVVGHTDEGSYIRRVLRRGGYCRPFGGAFALEVAAYRGIPIPTSRNFAIITGIIDGILLKSAGLVASCAPVVNIKGSIFPMIFSSSVADNEGRSRDHSRDIAQSCGGFVSAYVEALARLFCVGGFDNDVSELALRSAFMSMSGEVDRHLFSETVAPYFWVEPTSLFYERSNSAAEHAGFSCLAWVEERGSISVLPSVKRVGGVAGASLVTYEHRSARTVGLFVHNTLHKDDGLAAVLPAQFVSDQVVMAGGTRSASDYRAARSGWDAYAWGRGQSQIPAPAEFIYTEGLIGAYVIKGSLCQEDYSFKPNHVPEDDEMVLDVSFTCSSPSAIRNSRLGVFERSVMRARSAGARALDNARLQVLGGMNTDYGTFVFSDAPVIRLDDEPDRIPLADDAVMMNEPLGSIPVDKTRGAQPDDIKKGEIPSQRSKPKVQKGVILKESKPLDSRVLSKKMSVPERIVAKLLRLPKLKGKDTLPSPSAPDVPRLVDHFKEFVSDHDGKATESEVLEFYNSLTTAGYSAETLAAVSEAVLSPDSGIETYEMAEGETPTDGSPGVSAPVETNLPAEEGATPSGVARE